ncbi:hypothetical protein Rumeso_00997 [Rubellimicrobium mesophilum DSM 19309]|uniref:Type IV / VI secretion system DotU domain-containing protein n=1 Tax=Rubellimicrobium mesophilum DSM 19309 TaxID=442562 RepID=A0A017HTG6_9RHOB|nr:hypothetical protein Rumeso_00997 [Rubellimicrobium mesophilum DSM 19309]
MTGRPKASSTRADAVTPLGQGRTAYDQAAQPVLLFAEHLAEERHVLDPPHLLREARSRLDRFADDLGAARVPRATIAPARLALGLVLDEAARGNRTIPRREWSAGAHRLLYEGEDMSPGRVRDFAARAEAAGPAFADVAIFLRACLARVEEARTHLEQAGPDGWGGLLVAAVLGFAFLVLAWTLHAEWSFHRDTARAFAIEAVQIGLDRSGSIPDLPARLDRLAAAVRRVDGSLEKAPIHLFSDRLGFDAGRMAHAAEAEAIARHVPRGACQGHRQRPRERGRQCGGLRHGPGLGYPFGCRGLEPRLPSRLADRATRPAPGSARARTVRRDAHPTLGRPAPAGRGVAGPSARIGRRSSGGGPSLDRADPLAWHDGASAVAADRRGARPFESRGAPFGAAHRNAHFRCLHDAGLGLRPQWRRGVGRGDDPERGPADVRGERPARPPYGGRSVGATATGDPGHLAAVPRRSARSSLRSAGGRRPRLGPARAGGLAAQRAPDQGLGRGGRHGSESPPASPDPHCH